MIVIIEFYQCSVFFSVTIDIMLKYSYIDRFIYVEQQLICFLIQPILRSLITCVLHLLTVNTVMQNFLQCRLYNKNMKELPISSLKKSKESWQLQEENPHSEVEALPTVIMPGPGTQGPLRRCRMFCKVAP